MKHAGAIVLFVLALAFLMIAVGLLPTEAPFWAVLALSVVIVVLPVLVRRR